METEYRRKAPRRKFEGKIGVLFRGKMTITQCSQLGEGGALILSNTHLNKIKQDDFLMITLFLPNIGGLIAISQCVYLADNGNIGLQFQSLDTAYKKKVREFVSRRKTLEVA